MKRSMYGRVLLWTGCAMMGLLGGEVAVSTAAGHGEDGLGYEDTPMLPGSPWRVHDRKRPQPPSIRPGNSALAAMPATPPSDALVLFDGKDLSQWTGGDDSAIENGSINILKTKGLRTKQRFGDCQLHVEWATPAKADGNNLHWGNSGVLMMDRFEIQILESRDSRIYADGNAGAIYGQYPAMVNPARKPGQWQSFDIVFAAPRFAGGQPIQPAYATVLYNGVLVQYHRRILGEVAHRALPAYASTEPTGPIQLQQHGSAVKFRNIWVRPLKLEE
jgi:hypothetical protein